jgi:integrin alpha FG-GAP repeat containing protein 1
MASFFDLDENGQLDIIMTTFLDSTYKVIGYYNNYIYDAFFLKSVTLLSKNIFYSNELGVNYRYITTNLDGSRRMDVSYQGVQNGNSYMSLPYAYIGIGRSNNYIENFNVISVYFTEGQDTNKVFTPIIPNSQLIITKILDEDHTMYIIYKVRNWSLDLIVKPTSQLFILIITIVIILVVILAIIVYLHVKEVVIKFLIFKHEDQETENKNFIAWYS